MPDIKKLLRRAVPASVSSAVNKFRSRNHFAEYKKLSTSQAFTKIYEEGIWGQASDPTQRFFSGSGSHDATIVTSYVTAIEEFLKSFQTKPNVVDLGCGDFNVGSKIRPQCEGYIACDIVEPVIEFNRVNYGDIGVDFRKLDLVKDDLPAADVVFIRQVLQHLSNKNIQQALPKIAANYKFLILTEHVPADPSFVPNIDMPAGPGNRLAVDSGIVVTKSPFRLKVLEERVICEVPEGGALIVTTVYRLR